MNLPLAPHHRDETRKLSSVSAMLLYLDNCALNRPFDDQSQPRIWLETLAVFVIFGLIENGEVSLARSPMHDLENGRSPHHYRRLWVTQCLRLATSHIELTPAAEARATGLEATGLKPQDALHAALAESATADTFITCDDRILRRYHGPMQCLNPADFVLHIQRTQEP